MKKKIIIGLLALLLGVGAAGSFWGSSIAEAASGLWNSCPKGKVNDYYPGDCHDYIDTNRDDICDRSQPDPAAATATATVSSIQSNAAVTTTPITTTAAVPAATTATAAVTATPEAQGSGSGTGTGEGKNISTYYLLPIALATLVLYGISWILSAVKKFRVLTHRKIWNIVLLVTGAGSALLGLVRILIKDASWDITLPFNVLFWHVEISIVLSVVALFHIVWHWRYFTKLLGIGKNKTA